MKIGVVIRMSDNPALGGRAPTYHEIRRRAQDAEAAGFDSIWLYDHLIYRHEGRDEAGTWECWSLLSALAEATNRVEIGTIVLCVPFRNPAVLAKMAVTLDEVSNGRLILGLGAGWHEPEFAAFGAPFDHLGSRFEDGIRIIAPLVREGRVDYSGSYYQAPNCAILPTGPRQGKGGIPVLVAGSGPRMLRLTAQFADAWNTAWLGDPSQLAERRATLDAACTKVGRDPSSIELTVGVEVAFPELVNPQDLPARFVDHPENYLGGSAAGLAGAFRAYEELGASHLICAVTAPDNQAAFERLAAGLHAYKGV